MFIDEKPTFNAALPSRSRRAGLSSATVAARVTARPVTANVPLAKASRQTTTSENVVALSASAANPSASAT